MRQMSGALCANKRRIVVSVMSVRPSDVAAAIFPWPLHFIRTDGRTIANHVESVIPRADLPPTLDMKEEDKKKLRC